MANGMQRLRARDCRKTRRQRDCPATTAMGRVASIVASSVATVYKHSRLGQSGPVCALLARRRSQLGDTTAPRVGGDAAVPGAGRGGSAPKSCAAALPPVAPTCECYDHAAAVSSA